MNLNEITDVFKGLIDQGFGDSVIRVDLEIIDSKKKQTFLLDFGYDTFPNNLSERTNNDTKQYRKRKK